MAHTLWFQACKYYGTFGTEYIIWTYFGLFGAAGIRNLYPEGPDTSLSRNQVPNPEWKMVAKFSVMRYLDALGLNLTSDRGSYARNIATNDSGRERCDTESALRR